MADGDEYARLMTSYLHGVASISRAEGLGLSSPFFLAKDVLGFGANIEKTVQMLRAKRGRLENVYNMAICINYLVWCHALDSNMRLATEHPNIFEPLVKILEAGGSIGIHKGEVVVDSFAIPMSDWKG
ncbi:hypothetical protein FNU76_01695 [Chitinimonas arctica]|uniref:Uncharacterized protein n=1 Tax=Chitinimonas arctica TaxID=2594795 RepID=A0A516SAJ5_9NEIS|nr:hypothetical protein [Chitinimonas arctica]QDQ25172.1 hypothetical protein FNU76_01695 [Chitinimonas arctica]